MEAVEGLPREVEKQGEEAERLQKEIAEAGKTGEEKLPEEKKETPAQAPKKTEESKKEDKEKKKPAEVKADEVKPGEGDVDWQQKYLVLQGKYDAEVPQLRNNVADLKVIADDANQTIANLNTMVVEKKGEDPDPDKEKLASTDQSTELKTEDFEGYGDEMIDLINTVKGLATENKSLKGKVENLTSRQVVSAEDTFYDSMDAAVSDWVTINKTPEFLEWLSEVDPLSGLPRQKLLDGASKGLDATRVTHIFNLFKADQGIGASSETSPKETDTDTKGDLKNQVIPDSTGSTDSDPDGGKKPTVTAAQVKKAVHDFQTGRITEEERCGGI